MVMRGAPWGAGTGRKLAKYQVLMEVVVKNDKNQNCGFFWKINILISMFQHKNMVHLDFWSTIGQKEVLGVDGVVND